MKKWWWVIMVIVVLAGALYGGYRLLSGRQAAAAVLEPGAVETAVIERGTLRMSVDGAGSLMSQEEVAVAFETAGRVAAILVETGDVVSAGDVLARVDATDAERTLAEAELSVQQAEVSLASVKLKLDTLLTWAPDENAVVLAEANLAAAQADYERALASNARVGDQLTSSRVRLAQAERALVDAQEAYNSAFDPGREWELNDRRLGPRLESEREIATTQLTRAQEDVQVAQAAFNLDVAGISDSSVKSAWSKVVSTQVSLTREQTGPDEDEIESAEIQVQLAEISLAQALLKLEMARQALADTVLIAPVDGTVTEVALARGQMATTSQTAMVIADLARLVVEIGLDESDIAQVSEGQAAVVTLDAFDDVELSGAVIHVAPAATVQSGVVLYAVTVALDASALPVRPGMTADVEIVTQSVEGALLVPLKAVRSLDGQSFVVRGLREGEPMPVQNTGDGTQLRPSSAASGTLSQDGTSMADTSAQLRQQGYVLQRVELGMVIDAVAEVVSGLEERDVVTLVAATASPEAGLPVGPLGVGGLRGLMGGGQQ